VCVTVTRVDGLVLARSVFEHSVNYRSAMIYRLPRVVTGLAEELAGLRCLSEHLAPASGITPAGPAARELAAARLLPLAEASVKVRTGPPDDGHSPDAALGLWQANCRWPPPGSGCSRPGPGARHPRAPAHQLPRRTRVGTRPGRQAAGRCQRADGLHPSR
jgi:hypothetical protein